MASRRALALLAPALAALLAACSRKAFEAPELSDAPVVRKAALGVVHLTAPGYGIALSREGGVQFEVNLEAEDAPHVRAGDPCTAYSPPSTAAVACVVASVRRGVSEETGQAIAWLSPRGAARWPSGEFVFALITTGAKKNAVVVPPSAVLTKDGKSWVVVREPGKEGAAQYSPVEVATGDSSDGVIEVAQGLAAGQEVVVQGGVGYLYPEFKAGAD